MIYLKQKAVKQVFKGRKQISKEALQAIDRKVGLFLEKLVTEPREKRIDEATVSYYKL
jgi:hypothetical protein